MKLIAYETIDGTLAIVTPVPGARLAHSIIVDGRVLASETSQPVDQFLRGWPIEGAVAEWAETEDEFVNRVRVLVVPRDVVKNTIVDHTELPSDREFRDAWRLDDASRVVINMPAARAMHLEHVRQHRNDNLTLSDVEFFKALESLLAKTLVADPQPEAKAVLTAISARQKLRDAPQTLDLNAALTPEELKQRWPQGLEPTKT